ncbi:hypothetical protein Sru01_52550 [Sphaerisporangium rufum]|uniref:PemK-like, MazF-like toxin of type II toxin-antitoxin system n=1 Tax=Sphaerisporangium rufum TaxID=1381558 RepID=A0A919R6X4_9ACTN|nr:type II toxin-antitoxin system PemK/MazF family toxin [Sphaerisporangium rufum]GII80273.1 hypothetical protein Sru01_52550 [Sphaerisporangium rufum]
MSADRAAALLAALLILLAAGGTVLLLARQRSGRRGPARPAGRGARRPGGRRPDRGRRPAPAPGRRPAAPPRPAPREIWWADVPYSDGTGSKVRPCLVVRARAGGADVLKITSQDKSARDDHVPIPTRSWDPDAAKDSWLDLSETHFVGRRGFRERAAESCDARTWRQVTRHQAGSRSGDR